MKIPKRNPKMYQLVAMESESSFWWDSVDSSATLNNDEYDHVGGQKFAATDDGMLWAVVVCCGLWAVVSFYDPTRMQVWVAYLHNSSTALPILVEMAPQPPSLFKQDLHKRS